MDCVLLLVDDEENILKSLVRLFRRDGYTILTATSGKAGLEVLAANPNVGVILSDQRMPEMTGADFLSQVKQLYPETVRIMLSGYTDLNSVTDAINKGAIFKFLTKPWEDELLRTNVKEAFDLYHLVHENRRLSNELEIANSELAKINKALETQVRIESEHAIFNWQSLQVLHNVLEHLPFAIFGIDPLGTIVLANRTAHGYFDHGKFSLLGEQASNVLPSEINSLLINSTQNTIHAHIKAGPNDLAHIDVHCSRLSNGNQSLGWVIALTPPANENNK